jgi:hypothetical protein
MKFKYILMAALFLILGVAAQSGARAQITKDTRQKPGEGLKLVAMPDLIVERIAYDGKTEVARILVANTGKAQANAFKLGFGCHLIVGKGTGSDGKEFEVGSTVAASPVSVSSLNAGETRWLSIKMGKFDNIKKCTAEADTSKVIKESNESNNTLSTN